MASKTKNTKATKESLLLAPMLPSATCIVNQEYVLEPPNYEEKLWIYKSHVIIPYSISRKTHALKGLFPYVDLTKVMDFFLSYHRTNPMVSIKEPLNLEYMTATLRIFHSTPPTKKNEDYILWLKKIEAKMSEYWILRGIFDLIQLSRTDPSYFKTCWSPLCTSGRVLPTPSNFLVEW